MVELHFPWMETAILVPLVAAAVRRRVGRRCPPAVGVQSARRRGSPVALGCSSLAALPTGAP